MRTNRSVSRRLAFRLVGPGLSAMLLCVPAISTAGGFCTSNGQCDDSNPCTKDTCQQPACFHTPKNCDDGSPCTIDSCDAVSGACLNNPKNCDDGDGCTVDSCGHDGLCTTAPADCDDGLVCTKDSCHSGGCQHSPDTCGDMNPCTTDSCDPVTGCKHVTRDCTDTDWCTEDYCSNGSCVLEMPDVCTSTTTPPQTACGDANGDDHITTTDALMVLRTSVGTGSCDPCVCDVNASGEISAGDSLIVLRVAVDQPVVPSCPDC